MTSATPKPAPVSTAPPDLPALWVAVGDTATLDTQTATAKGVAADPSLSLPLHGSYTPVRYFRVHLSSDGKTPNAVLDVFDDTGLLGRFIWDGHGAWASSYAGVTFTVSKNNPLMKPPVPKTLYPVLTLAAYDASNVPSNWKAGDVYVTALGDGSKPVSGPAQTITCIGSGPGQTLTWTCTQPQLSLTLKVVTTPQHGVPATNKDDAFGALLRANPNAQLPYPFYGFNPGLSSIYPSDSRCLWLGDPGTPYVDYADMLTFVATLVFRYPAYDSMDYTRDQDPGNQPPIPLGTYWAAFNASSEQTHTDVLSTVNDRLRSWSTTLGLSAGLEGMLGDLGLGGTYASKVETQTKTQTRYTFGRRMTQHGVVHNDFSAQELHPTFDGAILALAGPAVEDGSSINWKSFVATYGTHYAHAITQGSLWMSETRFTLTNETSMTESSFSLKGKADAFLDALTVGTKDAVSLEWKQVKGVDVSTEDIEVISIGGQEPVGILFDLRPLTEVMSPVFYPYNPADAKGEIAPWIWHEVRSQFAKYLATLGLNQPVDPSYFEDFTPQQYQITISQLQVLWNGQPKDDLKTDTLDITITQPAASAGSPEPSCVVFKPGSLSIRHTDDTFDDISQPAFVPDPTKMANVLIVQAPEDVPLVFDLGVTVKVWQVDRGYVGTGMQEYTTFNVNTLISLDRSDPDDPSTYTFKQSAYGVEFTLSIDIQPTLLGPIVD